MRYDLGNEDGTVCCICGRPLVPHGDEAFHGAYHGAQARHYNCHDLLHPRVDAKSLLKELDTLKTRVDNSLAELRRAVRELDR